MPYLKLLHGCREADDELESSRGDGPIFGPYANFTVINGKQILFNDDDCLLSMVKSSVYYDGLFYLDWVIFAADPDDDEINSVIDFEQDKALIPEERIACACQQPGFFHCGITGILAHLENGRVPPDARIERCDQCERFETDDAAKDELIRRGLVPSEDQIPKRVYSVLCYATVSVRLPAISATSAEEAARMASQQFDWEAVRNQTEFADELSEFLVDVEGDLDFSRSRRFNADFEEIDV